ncbi:NAD(P)/FAD-dependent oxidoreductase [Sphingomonas sp. LHG3406-1]|uniref:flavin-containing monooxygenase n=1 Tax=Sphingomonas sp. LHG3406-1 TaxID=2804617 RepID=UPI00262E6C33|nr:NAD(P)/FAD-dependent oxidoreductase [Sphingomonas sp. LHG3406-1]
MDETWSAKDEPADPMRIAAGIDQANIPSLLMLLVQLTGDRKWLAEPYAPRRAKGLDDNDDGGLAPPVQREIRDAAKVAVRSWLDDGVVALPAPADEELATMLSVSMGEPVPAEYGEIVAFNMGLRRPPAQPPLGRRLKAIIIGAGVSGICAAINLERIGVDWTIVEKNLDVGGTWWENRYPGCGVDTPNFTYTFSFAPWDWPHYFPLQGEILRYIRTVSDRFGVREGVQFGTRVEEARWDEEEQRWAVTVTGPDGRRTDHADIVLSAVGVLNVPLKPAIAGVETFPGPVVHTAEWHDGLDVRGKRVAVVGNGASAMQLVPEIAPQVAELTVFARSKQWAAPFPQFRREVPPDVRYLMQHVPLYRQWYEQRLTWTFNDRIHSSLFKDPDWAEPDRALNAVNDGHRRFFTNYVKEELGDRQDLLEHVLPDFPPFAKRMLLDNGWYRTLRRSNVRLVPDRLASVEGNRLTAAGGESVEADMIVLATGFRAAEVLGSYEVIGRDGRRLKDVWETDNAAAYLGATVPGFPNFFVLLGPNVGSGHGGSMIRSIENQTHYVLDAIRQLVDRGAAAIEVRPEVYEGYKSKIDEAHARMVWTHPGAENWYRNSRGRIVAITPWRNEDFWRMTRRADPDDYQFEPMSAKVAPA